LLIISASVEVFNASGERRFSTEGGSVRWKVGEDVLLDIEGWNWVGERRV
jgi:hypothetical protein